MKATSAGVQYLEYTERETKTRKGSGAARPFCPKMFAMPGNPRCPVLAFKHYIRRRPAQCLEGGSRFYIQTLHKYKPNKLKGENFDHKDSNVWYSQQPLGRHSLGDIVKTMAEKANLSGRKVNHSARKTTVTSLLHSNVAPTTVMQLTGHRNVQSINNYSSASEKQQMEMSHMLSDIGSGNKGVEKENIFDGADSNENVNNVTDMCSLNMFDKEIEVFESVSEKDDQDLVQAIYNLEQSEQNKAVNYRSSKNQNSVASVFTRSRFNMFSNAHLGNVTINIYGSDAVTGTK